MNAPANGMSPQQANAVARTLITNNAVIRHQSIYSRAIDPAVEPVINIQPRYAGLILGFIVNIRTNVAVASGGTPLTRTNFGPLNLVNEVRLDDLNNNTRIQTSGWHLGMLNSARSGDPYLVTRQNDSYPVGVGKFFDTLMEGGASIAADANSDVAATYYVPCAYSEKDLRGAIFANVVNATMQLQLTLNQAVAAARTLSAGSDAVYVTADSSTAPGNVTVGNFEIEVIQVYYDKLPQGDAGYVLPLLDLGTVYEIKRSQDTGLVQGQDFQISYSNFRDFLSTFVLYRNRVSPTAAFATEADINYWALETANFTQIYKLDPRFVAKWARQTIENDFPLGLYYFPTREKPISTNNFGNMQLVLNPADVQTNAAALIGFEAFALTSRIGQAASLSVG